MNSVYAGAISFSNEAAVILAAGSFALTMLAMLLTVAGVRSAAKANEHAKEMEYLREKRKEGVALLKTVTGGADAYIDGVSGRHFSDSQMMLAAALLADHPELLPSIKAARRYLATRNEHWDSVKVEMDNTIKVIEQQL